MAYPYVSGSSGLLVISVCAAVMLVLLSSFVSYSHSQMATAVFVFGDSLVDVGNNNHLPLSLAKADFPHNGIDFPTHKPTGRFSNGQNAADFLAKKLGLPTSPPYLSLVANSSKSNTSPPPFLTGVSFASGGAGIFDGTDKLYKQSLPLSKQIEYYVTVHKDLVNYMGASAASKHLAKSLFAIVIGSNDIFGYSGSSELRQKQTPRQYVDLMASTLKDYLKTLYSNDARKFVFVGLGPIGCCPSQRNQNKTGVCNEDSNLWSRMYNERLIAMLQGLKSELKDMSYTYYNTYSVLQSFIDKPATYGFTEVKAACCGLGNLNAKIACLPISNYCSNWRDHAFWDLYHPTEAAAQIFIDEMFSGHPEYTFPMTMQQLAAV